MACTSISNMVDQSAKKMRYLFIYPLQFIPMTLWKLFQAAIKSQDGFDGDKTVSSEEEDKAKK